MDIAIISEHASPTCALGGADSGGQNVYVAQLARHLGRLGHEVEVFTRRDDSRIPIVQDLKEGFRLVNVPAGPAHPIAKEKILKFMPEFTHFVLKYMRTREKKFDIIHSNFWMSGLVGADIKKELNIPLFVTFHALGRVRRIHQGEQDSFPDIRFAIEDRVVAEADGVIAECPQDQEDLITFYNAPVESLSVVPCGFDPMEMRPIDKTEARQVLGLDVQERVVLHLGRMVPRKGADNVIRGFARYCKEALQPTRLLIVGGESERPDPRVTPEIARLMQIARDEGVANRVQFVGRRERKDLRIYYSAADVFVTTPWYEPFGITPVEAMACGTPVIGSAVGGIKYTVSHEETGLLVPPNDPDSLKSSLQKILEDESLRRKFGRKGIERVNRHFRWDIMAMQIEKLFFEHHIRTMKAKAIFLRSKHEGVSDANSNYVR